MPNLIGIIERVAIVVDDLSSTIEFYKKYLGFEIEKQFHNHELGIKAAILVRKNSRIELFEYSKDTRETEVKRVVKRSKLKKVSFEKGIHKITFRSGTLQTPRTKRRTINALPSKNNMNVFYDPNGFILEEISDRKSKRIKSQ